MSPDRSDAAAPPTDATALAEKIRRRDVSAAALMEASIARAEADPFGSICHLDAQMGREAAAAFDRQMAKRDPAALDAPFAGLPFLAKDLGNIARDLQSVSPWSYPADIAGAKA